MQDASAGEPRHQREKRVQASTDRAVRLHQKRHIWPARLVLSTEPGRGFLALLRDEPYTPFSGTRPQALRPFLCGHAAPALAASALRPRHAKTFAVSPRHN